jgi:hypothetical protein
METKKGISFGMTFTFLDPLSENPGSLRNLYYQTMFHLYDLNNYRSVVYEGLNLLYNSLGVSVKVTFRFILFS